MQSGNRNSLGKQVSYRRLQQKFKDLNRDYAKYKQVVKKHIDPITYMKIVAELGNGKTTKLKSCSRD